MLAMKLTWLFHKEHLIVDLIQTPKHHSSNK